MGESNSKFEKSKEETQSDNTEENFEVKIKEKISMYWKKRDDLNQKISRLGVIACPNETEWLYQNSYDSSSRKFQKKKKEYEKCKKRNGLNFDKYLLGVKELETIEIYEEDKINCKSQCNTETKNVDLTKMCIQKCLMEARDRISNMFDKFDEKLNEINNKL